MITFREITAPEIGEYPSYSQIYMDLLKNDGSVLNQLYENFHKIKVLISSLSEEQLLYKYDENKWTIKEILVHLIDDERIFAYKALRYARNDNTPLHGFEEKDYAKYSYADTRSLNTIIEEYWAVRNSTILLFQNLPNDSFLRSGGGVDDDGKTVNIRTVRALAYHIAGHELWHIKIIKERYLKLILHGDVL